MNKQLELILNYQDVDCKIKAIDDKVKKSEISQKYFSATKFLNSVKETTTNLELKSKSLVDAYNATKAEIEKFDSLAKEYSSTVESCENEEELAYAKKKFQETIDNFNALESKLNALSKDMESVLKEFNFLRVKTKEMQALRDEVMPKVKELTDSVKKEKDALSLELDKIGSSINQELLEKYKAKRKDIKLPILCEASIQKDSAYCPACGMSMISSVKNALLSGEIKECENCKKLLYVKN